MRALGMAILLMLISRPAPAQVFELGGGVGRGCTGDSSGFCGDQAGLMWAGHASMWVTPAVEIGVRLAVLPLPDRTFETPPGPARGVASPEPRTVLAVISNRDRSRLLAGGELTYHFARGGPAGFMAGAGLGSLSDRMTISCVPAGCERLPPMASTGSGRIASNLANLTAIVGLSGRAGRRLHWRAGVRLHNFAGEGLSTTEAFAAAGWRIGRS